VRIEKTATATGSRPNTTATGSSVFSGSVQPGFGFFPVRATGPSNTKCVDDLLSTEALSTEIKDLESLRQYNIYSHKSYYSTSNLPPSHIINFCFNQIESMQVLSNILPTFDPNSIKTQLIQFCIMQKAANALPMLNTYRLQQVIIMRAINREICHSLVILVDIEPQLIGLLMHI
jgi:hypothetical protein